MIKVQVHLSNSFESRYDDIEITKEDILQLACDKAKGMYLEGYYTRIQADSEVEVNFKN